MISTSIFTQVGLDSGALTLLGVVARRLEQAGQYRGVVLVDDATVGDFQFTVADEGLTQLDIDLAMARGRDAGCGCGKSGRTGSLRVGGYVVFHVGSGDDRYSVVITRMVGQEEAVVFDSRRLEKNDVFAATVLRPGRYTVTNSENQARADLEVAMPQRGRTPYRPAEPLHIVVGPEFSPSEIAVGSGQGQVYTSLSEARIVIELVEPYDPEPKPGPPRFRRARQRETG